MHGSNYFKRPAEYYRKTQWTYPDSLRLRGSVIPAVLKDVFIITSFSCLVMGLETAHVAGENRTLNVPGVIVPALSVVVGLILAFRTNTAYDRFWEGRKLWSSLDVQIRNFSRMIWVGMKEVPHTLDDGSSSTSSRMRSRIKAHHLFGRSNATPKVAAVKATVNGSGSSTSNGSISSSSNTIKTTSTTSTVSTVTTSRTENAFSATLIDIDVHLEGDYEKILVIRLLLAFAVSVKHQLRQEFGVKWYDLEELLPAGFESCAVDVDRIKKDVYDKALGDNRRQYNEEPWNIHAGNEDGQMSLPLEVAHALTLWVIAESRAGRIDNPLINLLLTSINTMTDIFTNMERIVFTPIPLAYSIHLRQVVYLYCLALPFTFIDALGWLLVPLLFLVSFTLFGMEAIGREIENPFGKDENDLHMDEFCQDLKRELCYLVNLKTNIPPGAHY
ncbi:hypothetical protein BGZ70_001566 [Mortierella alpina]|uniref:Uncharacterized protein n=1 Tax=Mortierella alpina TaxID=64518 RepID=A0A9P6IVM0_MORAP|nr:hypothetical protein BGZ70_001566 [Mortierella alpina]